MKLIVLRNGEENHVEIEEQGHLLRVTLEDRTFDVDSAATNGAVRSLLIEGKQFGGGHSVFTHNLITGLSQGTADMNGDGIIPASELYSYLAPRITRDSGGRQTPKIFNMEGVF